MILWAIICSREFAAPPQKMQVLTALRFGEGGPLSLWCGAEDGPFCPARRLSFANSSSRAFLASLSAFVLAPAFAMGCARFGVLGWRTGSTDHDGGEPPAAKYRASRNCFDPEFRPFLRAQT